MASGVSNTSDISWIRLVLTSRYPNIVRDKGADLDNNGKIEGKEAFGDLDGSGTVDDNDFWMYLERNRSSIAKQIEFVNWQGKNISDDNIINHLLFVESQIRFKGDVRDAYKKINEIIAGVKKQINGKERPKDMLASVYQMLKSDFSIRFKDQDSALFVENLSRRELDCDTGTFLFLAIAHECKWPLSAVRAPKHVFMRWEDGNTTFNYDIGGSFVNGYYREWLNIDEKAIKNGVFLKSLSQKETVGLFYGNRGDAESGYDDYKEAIDDYGESARLNPDNDLVYQNRGSDKFNLRDYKGAIDDFNEAVRLNPGNAEAFNNCGGAKFMLCDYKGAIDEHDKAIKIDPENAMFYFTRAYAKYKLGDYKGGLDDINHKEAIDDYNEEFKRDPGTVTSYVYRGDARYRLGHYKGAVDDYNAVIRMYPECAEVHRKRGDAKYRLGDYFGAVDDYTVAVRFDLNDATAFHSRASAELKILRIQSACADYMQWLIYSHQNQKGQIYHE